jgi:hypothetical protein
MRYGISGVILVFLDSGRKDGDYEDCVATIWTLKCWKC